MTRLKTSLVIAALLLTACCTQPAQVAAEPSVEPVLTLGPDGISGLDGQVPFTLPAVERAFEGFEVVSVSNGGVPVFHVREPGTTGTLFIVSPDWTRGFVGSVSAVLPAPEGGFEIRAGATPYSAVQEWPGIRCAGFTCDLPLAAGTLRLNFPATGDDPVLDRIAYIPAPAGP